MTVGMNPRSWRLRFAKEHLNAFQRREKNGMSTPLCFHWNHFKGFRSEREKGERNSEREKPVGYGRE